MHTFRGLRSKRKMLKKEVEKKKKRKSLKQNFQRKKCKLCSENCFFKDQSMWLTVTLSPFRMTKR